MCGKTWLKLQAGPKRRVVSSSSNASLTEPDCALRGEPSFFEWGAIVQVCVTMSGVCVQIAIVGACVRARICVV